MANKFVTPDLFIISLCKTYGPYLTVMLHGNVTMSLHCISLAIVYLSLFCHCLFHKVHYQLFFGQWVSKVGWFRVEGLGHKEPKRLKFLCIFNVYIIIRAKMKIEIKYFNKKRDFSPLKFQWISPHFKYLISCF
jgi:hypothetical protein